MISSVKMIASTSSMTMIGGILVRFCYVTGVFHTRNGAITSLQPVTAAAVRLIDAGQPAPETPTP
jgi:hypothetical protein